MYQLKISIPKTKWVLNELGLAIKQYALGNDKLSYIANGCEGELLNDRPFDFTFTKDRILKADKRVGYFLFTRTYLRNKHVRHSLEQREKNNKIE